MTKLDIGKMSQISVVAANISGKFSRFPKKNHFAITRIEWESIAATILAQQAQIEALREFTQYALDLHSWDNEPDGGDLQDKAEELKLIELRSIDPEDAIMDETEQYFCVWTPVAARKGGGGE